MRFEYFTRGLGNGTAIADFSIVWYRSNSQTPQALDNSQNLRIIIYKCEQLAVNCGLCLGLDMSRFECGWCNAESRCTFRDACPSDWMTRGVGTPVCPNPRIDDFYPKKGPINGGTKVLAQTERTFRPSTFRSPSAE